MLQFTGRGSQYCVSAVGGFTGGFSRREGGMAAGLLRQWPLLILALLSTAMITESVNAGVIKLNAELTSGGDVDSYGLQFSPDGSRVLYLAASLDSPRLTKSNRHSTPPNYHPHPPSRRYRISSRRGPH